MQEAQRLDALGLLADAVGQAQALEAAVLKLHTSWRRLGGCRSVSGWSGGTPYLRDVLDAAVPQCPPCGSPSVSWQGASVSG